MNLPFDFWSRDDDIHQILVVKFNPHYTVGEIFIEAVGPDSAPIRLGEICLEGFPDSWNVERNAYLAGGKDLLQQFVKCSHGPNLVLTPDVLAVPQVCRPKDGLG